MKLQEVIDRLRDVAKNPLVPLSPSGFLFSTADRIEEDGIDELKELQGIQRILADCREESSAWHDGYRQAIKDITLDVFPTLLNQVATELGDDGIQGMVREYGLGCLRIAEMTIGHLTPEISIQSQRQIQS